ncbi:TetR/AcrR family transcriptional regulator [Nocardioides sp.]|uniref:TetR/AcrR family transcriptional regulator n=1 Tax=Nocardioides sp. TaxID=35761 RepID=UPI0039E58B9E
MTQTPRARARAQTMADILRIGREHLASEGAAALSLRAVARDLGVVSSAIYRYVASRDELLTLLVVEGYGQLGDAVDEALAGVQGPRERLLALGRAVRGWAVAEPATYALLFGSPVPGYTAPAEQTNEPGTRVVRALMAILGDAYAGGLARRRAPVASPVLRQTFAAVREEYALDLPDDVLAAGACAWASLFGCVTFEVFGQYGPGGFGDPAALFEHHLGVIADTVLSA